MKLKGIGIAVLAVCGIVLLVIVLHKASEVTPAKAQEACKALAADLRNNVAKVPGYEIIREAKPSCEPIEDEMMATDYKLSAALLLKKLPDGSTEATIRPDITAFVDALPNNEYGIHVENAYPKPDQPMLLCVSAERYLNNDGDYIPQGSTDNDGKFIDASMFEESYGYGGACRNL